MDKEKLEALENFVEDCLIEQNVQFKKQDYDENVVYATLMKSIKAPDETIETHIWLLENHIVFICPYTDEYEYSDPETAMNLAVFLYELNGAFDEGQFHIMSNAKRPCYKTKMFLPEDWQDHKDVFGQLFKHSCKVTTEAYESASGIIHSLISGEIEPNFEATLGLSFNKKSREFKRRNDDSKKYS